MVETKEDNAVKPEELQSVLRQYTPERTIRRERDMLSQRYRILVNSPLDQFSSCMAKAFSVQDTQAPESSLYALVYDNNAIPRKKNIAALKEYRHPNLLALLDDGMAEISLYSESRYVVILERPTGQSLALLLSAEQKNPVSESTVISHLIRPLTDILKSFAAVGISHNRINLNNSYLSNGNRILGECVSEPSGYSQHFLFEPTDRMLASIWGKQEFAIDADCYALGMLALHLILGYQPFVHVRQDDAIKVILAKGSYHSLVIQWELSENMQDLFRALLNDINKERCAPEFIEYWLSGKNFNLILPSATQETARPFDFCGKSYFNRKSLAHAMFQNWEEAKALLFNTKLPRWIESALHKKDLSDAVARAASNTLGDTARAERQNNELLARIIMLLDPTGPIRFKTLSCMPDGISHMMVHFYFNANDSELQNLQQVIECDLAGQWLEFHKDTLDTTLLKKRLQKIRSFLRIHALGFGIERCLYDSYPSLACQSPLVKRFGATTLPEIFYALDTIAPAQQATETDFMDIHIAAFIASKLDIGKEIHIHELELKDLVSTQKLIALKLLERTQYAVSSHTAKGLTYWIALRLFPMLSYLHRKNVRHKMQERLHDAAASGIVSSISNVLLNQEVFTSDAQAFRLAVAAYASRKYQIAKLNDPREQKKHSRMVGRGFAQTLAYGTCIFTLYFTLHSYFHF